MKNYLILLPLFLILAIIIFFILTYQVISKEIKYPIINKNSFVEERIDDTWTIEEGMMDSSELLISINGKIIHADRMRYRLMEDCETINVLTQFSTMKKIQRLKELINFISVQNILMKIFKY